MWASRLRGEARFEEAVTELWPYAVALLEPEQRADLAARAGRRLPSNELLLALERGTHADDWPSLWQEMTSVRRSLPGAVW